MTTFFQLFWICPHQLSEINDTRVINHSILRNSGILDRPRSYLCQGKVSCPFQPKNGLDARPLQIRVFSQQSALFLAPFCDSAPSRESVNRTSVTALLRTDGSLCP